MRAKIIADIAVIVSFILLFRWWIKNVPFQKLPYDQTTGQALAIFFTAFWMLAGFAVVVVYILFWIHKEK